jgi:hypothetical protein
MPTKPFRTLALAGFISFTVGGGGCKDPNPTFVFDAASDALKEGAGDANDGADAPGGAGGGSGQGGGDGGAAGTGGLAGAGGGA